VSSVYVRNAKKAIISVKFSARTLVVPFSGWSPKLFCQYNQRLQDTGVVVYFAMLSLGVTQYF
jgi:hypothetical protein